MARKEKDSLVIVINTFKKEGFGIEEALVSSLDRRTTVRGQYIRCIDPRIDDRTEPDQMGPAVAGGILGLAFLLEDSRVARGYLARLDRALRLVDESNFRASTHGDLRSGAVKGCKLLYALTQKVLPGDSLTEKQVLDLIDANGIDHRLLAGTADPIGFAVNNEPNTTIIPRRKKYAADIWYLDELGLHPQNYARKLAHVAKLLLPEDRRNLIVPVAG